jgi:hypothetical protein
VLRFLNAEQPASRAQSGIAARSAGKGAFRAFTPSLRLLVQRPRPTFFI